MFFGTFWHRRDAEINKRLAELTTRFANNVLNDEESYVTAPLSCIAM